MSVKKITLLLVILLMTGLFPQVIQAQSQSNVITLNDDVPGIDVIVTTRTGTIGVVYLEVRGASITATNEAGVVVFETTDPRVYAVELRFLPTSRRYTVTLQRLSDFTEAYVMVKGEAELRDFGNGTATVTTGEVLSLSQQKEVQLTDDEAGLSFSVVTANNIAIALTMKLPQEDMTIQVVDNVGVAIATVYGSIDSLNMVMLGGEYDITMLKSTWGTVLNAVIFVNYALNYPLG